MTGSEWTAFVAMLAIEVFTTGTVDSSTGEERLTKTLGSTTGIGDGPDVVPLDGNVPILGSGIPPTIGDIADMEPLVEPPTGIGAIPDGLAEVVGMPIGGEDISGVDDIPDGLAEVVGMPIDGDDISGIDVMSDALEELIGMLIGIDVMPCMDPICGDIIAGIDIIPDELAKFVVMLSIARPSSDSTEMDAVLLDRGAPARRPLLVCFHRIDFSPLRQIARRGTIPISPRFRRAHGAFTPWPLFHLARNTSVALHYFSEVNLSQNSSCFAYANHEELRFAQILHFFLYSRISS